VQRQNALRSSYFAFANRIFEKNPYLNPVLLVVFQTSTKNNKNKEKEIIKNDLLSISN
jgi:hypothetical protein